MTDLIQNIATLKSEVNALAQSLNRPPPRILGATKKKPTDLILEAAKNGLTLFGENYAQELEAKCTEIQSQAPDNAKTIEWHFIGNLQRNKVKKVVPFASCIQTLDSIELAETIDRLCGLAGRKMNVMIEVNIGDESSKSGISPESARELARGLNRLERIHLTGLMTIPPLESSLNQERQFYRAVRELLDDMNRQSCYRSQLTELSMGMSHDYRTAIEEGSTLIRIGERLFGPRS